MEISGISISKTFDQNFLEVAFIKSDLKKVLNNLIYNAIKQDNLKVNQGATTSENNNFAINILSKNQIDICKHFSGKDNKNFNVIKWHISSLELPVLNDSVAIFECEIYQRYNGGDHEIILGRVLNHHNNEKIPLIYGKSEFSYLNLANSKNEN